MSKDSNPNTLDYFQVLNSILCEENKQIHTKEIIEHEETSVHYATSTQRCN
jgi:hypothetical protein